MLTNVHTGFENDKHPAFTHETDEKIREFAEWASKKLPEHISSFVLIVDRYGYVTNAIPNKVEISGT
jgi:hypothetical protein